MQKSEIKKIVSARIEDAEARYNPIGNVNEADAKNMLESTKKLIKQL